MRVDTSSPCASDFEDVKYVSVDLNSWKRGTQRGTMIDTTAAVASAVSLGSAVGERKGSIMGSESRSLLPAAFVEYDEIFGVSSNGRSIGERNRNVDDTLLVGFRMS